MGKTEVYAKPDTKSPALLFFLWGLSLLARVGMALSALFVGFISVFLLLVVLLFLPVFILLDLLSPARRKNGKMVIRFITRNIFGK